MKLSEFINQLHDMAALFDYQHEGMTDLTWEEWRYHYIAWLKTQSQHNRQESQQYMPETGLDEQGLQSQKEPSIITDRPPSGGDMKEE